MFFSKRSAAFISFLMMSSGVHLHYHIPYQIVGGEEKRVVDEESLNVIEHKCIDHHGYFMFRKFLGPLVEIVILIYLLHGRHH